MLKDVFLLTVDQIAVFLAFFLVGLLLGKWKILPEGAGATLSRLVLYVFLPGMTFISFAEQCTVEKLGNYALMLAAGSVALLLLLPLGHVVQRRFPGTETDKLTALYSMVFPNFGYIGYPLVAALYGQAFLSQFMMFGLPFTVCAYAYMVRKWMPAGQSLRGRNVWGQVLNPTVVAILLGAMWGVLQLPIPQVLDNICEAASDCVYVCPMILTGFSISRISLRQALLEKRAYGISAIRLLALPAVLSCLVFAISRAMGVDGAFLLVIGTFMAMPLGMNPVVFCETYGKDGTFGAECAFISLLMSVATLPVMVGLQNYLAGLLG